MIDNNLWQETINENILKEQETMKITEEDDLQLTKIPSFQDEYKFGKFSTFQRLNRVNLEDDSPSKRRKESNNSINLADAANSEKEIMIINCKKCNKELCVNGELWGIRETITKEGKLITLFTCLMIQLGHLNDAFQIIEEYGFKYKDDKMSLANAHKLFALALLMDWQDTNKDAINEAINEARNEAKKHLDKASEYYKQVDSAHGLASTYYLKSYAVKILEGVDSCNKIRKNIHAKTLAKKAMKLYKLINHKEGIVACSKLIGYSEPPQNKANKISYINDPDYIPFNYIISDKEFLSLGIEPILTIKYESQIDKKIIKLISENGQSLKKVKVMNTNQLIGSDEDEFDEEAHKQFERSYAISSMTLKSDKEIAMIKKKSSHRLELFSNSGKF